MSSSSLESPLADLSTLAARAYRPMRRASGLGLMRCQCRAGTHDRAVDEEHQAFSITLVERGTFTYRTRSGMALLRPGWLMLGNQGDAYACSHEHGDGSGDDCMVLTMSDDTLAEALGALGRSSPRNRFGRAGLPPSPRVAAVLNALIREGDEGFALEEAALAVVDEVERALHDGAAPPAPARNHDRAVTAAQCMEARAAEPLTLDDVAQAAGVSAFHLMRVFRASTGITPHQYLMRVRLLRAMALLRDTATPIIDIAYDAGWSDLSNFNRAFRRDVGCSPGEYRRGDRKLLQRRT
jgi:AraC family transcriptional regulator